ncbi:MAG: UDP-glucose 4-epimerase GalE [Flavobacteriales bacterium]|jgi:UDP-glucose 4-epimerase|nr:UDP-glucose 4-epimerase GalE [Flavobacteriales bacterium]
MKIIVTGGAGFIGSHTVVELIERGHTPIIVDDFRNSKKFIIEKIEKITQQSIKTYEIDCCNLQLLADVFINEKPDGIIHFAAYKAVGESVNEPLKYYNNNLNSLTNILELMKKHHVKNIVFSSSCTVYGTADKIPVTEQTPRKTAESPYGNTKQIGEDILTDFFKSENDKNVTILRYFNPIGAHPSGLIGELPIGTPNNLVPYITQTAAGIREELSVFGDDYPTKDGTCIRDYIHVVDLATAHIYAIEKIAKQNKQLDIYNVGVGIGTTVLEVVETFEDVTQKKLNYTIGNRRPGDVVEIYSDNTKIVKELNWTPKYTLRDALKDAWNWQKKMQND